MIRQVTKLVTGVGVEYHHWPAGVVFRKGEPVTLQDDLAEIKEEAKDFEAQQPPHWSEAADRPSRGQTSCWKPTIVRCW